MSLEKTILFVHHAPHLGGATISGELVLRAISDTNSKVIIYCNSRRYDTVDYFKEKGYNVFLGGNSPVSFLHYSGDDLFFLSIRAILNYIRILRDKIKIRNFIKEINPDVVIINSMTLFWIGKIAKDYNSETICFFRETFVKGMIGLRTYLIKLSLNKYFDKIVFISRYDFTQNKTLTSKKKIIYNAIDTLKFNKKSKYDEKKHLGLEEGIKYVVYVGGFHKIKGPHILINAINELDRDDVKFIFLGVKWRGAKKYSHCKTWSDKIKYIINLDYEKKCIDLIYKYNIIKKINFYPPMIDTSHFFNTSDLLVSPMIVPHQSRPIFEAGYSRLPVLITDFPNNKEFINENNGFLFTKGDYKILAEKINYILNNPRIANKKAHFNYIMTKERHSFQELSSKIKDLLES